MPLYDWECRKCGKQEERFDYVGERKDRRRCECGGTMRTIIKKAPMGLTMDSEDWDDGAGRTFSGYMEKQKWLKDNNKSEVGYTGVRSPMGGLTCLKD